MPKTGFTLTNLLYFRTDAKTVEEINKLASTYGSGAEAIRCLVNQGLQIEALRKIMNEPGKKVEFEGTLKNLFDQKTMHEGVQALTDDELKTIKLIIQIEETTRNKLQVQKLL